MRDTPRKKMELYLANIVIPVIRNKGFKGSFPHFRRLKSDRINLITFQFAQSGGSFVIELVNCPPTEFETSWGKKIPPNKLTPAYFLNRKRIKSNTEPNSNLSNDWFRYDQNVLSGEDTYRNICDNVLSKLKIAEDYWENGPISDK